MELSGNLTSLAVSVQLCSFCSARVSVCLSGPRLGVRFSSRQQLIDHCCQVFSFSCRQTKRQCITEEFIPPWSSRIMGLARAEGKLSKFFTTPHHVCKTMQWIRRIFLYSYLYFRFSSPYLTLTLIFHQTLLVFKYWQIQGLSLFQ